jgi:hypothetical protein
MTRTQARVIVLKYLITSDGDVRVLRHLATYLKASVGWAKKLMTRLTPGGPVHEAFRKLVGSRPDTEKLFLSFAPGWFKKPVSAWQTLYSWLRVDALGQKVLKTVRFYLWKRDQYDDLPMDIDYQWSGALYSRIGEAMYYISGRFVDDEEYVLGTLCP